MTKTYKPETLDEALARIDKLEIDLEDYNKMFMSYSLNKVRKSELKEAYSYITELESKNIFQLIYWFFTKKKFID